MRRALGAGWQYSLKGFFSAVLQGAGAITKAAPVSEGDA